MWGEPHLVRSTTCIQCGRRFADDCGDSICSSDCEKEYAAEHEKCIMCEEEVGEDNLTKGLCDHCIEGDESE